MFDVQNLTVTVEDKVVVAGISFTIVPGTTCLLMGPNGSGKSSVASAIAGHPRYATTGSIMWNGADLAALSPDKRAQAGLFYVPQYVPALPGVTVKNFIVESYRACTKKKDTLREIEQKIEDARLFLGLSASLLERSLHDGFSGGEKKRCELLQLLVLQPSFIILDEIDSGLDSDGIALVVRVIAHLRSLNPSLSALIITHYGRLLDLLTVDNALVLVAGTIRQHGDARMAQTIIQSGYSSYATY